ncbi:hypothetical protein, partial [Burkholderia ubonensis]|uniref:hypothetical protein n=1 Tax=Burkholderia ubonensis TaxID=101571 RepID=UPI0012FCE5C9
LNAKATAPSAAQLHRGDKMNCSGPITYYLKSVGSIGRKRIKSTAPFTGVARVVRANSIISLAIVIFYSTIAITEILEFSPF